MYSLDICSLKMIATFKFIDRIFAKLKNIIHNNKRGTIFYFISFNSKVLYFFRKLWQSDLALEVL